MTRLAMLLALAAIVVGIAGLGATTERATAQVLPPVIADGGHRFDLDCGQILAPNHPDNPRPGVGIVRCDLELDLPAFLTPPLPDTIELVIFAAYLDRDDNNRPSRGDKLLCIRITLPNGTVLFERCRPGVDPGPLSPPNWLP